MKAWAASFEGYAPLLYFLQLDRGNLGESRSPLMHAAQVTIPLITITAVRTASFSIYTGVKDQFYQRRWVKPHEPSSVVVAGFFGGAASGLLLSCGTSAFEYTKVSFL